LFNSEGLEGLNPRPGFALQYLVCKEIEYMGEQGFPMSYQYIAV